jgi:hypothetical protein
MLAGSQIGTGMSACGDYSWRSWVAGWVGGRFEKRVPVRLRSLTHPSDVCEGRRIPKSRSLGSAEKRFARDDTAVGAWATLRAAHCAQDDTAWVAIKRGSW